MSTRVPSLDMKNLSNILVEVVNWYQLGINLNIKGYKLEEIRRNKHGDIAMCKMALIDLWLRSDIKASWEKLVEVLEEMDEAKTVEKIRIKYLQGAGGGGNPSPMSIGHSSSGTVPFGVISGALPPNNPVAYSQGIMQPVIGQSGAPEDEIRRAQKMIDDGEAEGGEAGTRLLEMVNNLANWNFDINTPDAKDFYKNTLLHYSALRGDLSTVKALVALGADINILNSTNHTALDSALMVKKTEVAKFLQEVGGMQGTTLALVNLPQSSKEERRQVVEDGEDQMREEVGVGGEHLILSIDSSSTMALVQLEVLNQLEKTTGKKITDIFEWIVASGVGGFLMMAMVYGHKSISELRRIYFRLRERVFSGQDLEKRGRELENYAVEIFTSFKRMADTVDYAAPKLLIGAVNKESTNLNPFFFSNIQEEHATMHVWKVARYTCSTPLFIGECDNFIDGGAICKNPAISALGNIRELYTMQSTGMHGIVSIGDGLMPGRPLGRLDASNYYTHFLLSKMNSLCEAVSVSCASICEGSGMSYHRFNPLLDEYIPVPEEATLEQLIRAVLHTVIQYKSENRDMQDFSRKFNNI